MYLLFVYFMVFILLCFLYLLLVIVIYFNIDFLISVYNVFDNRKKKKMECENLLLLKNRLFFL